jgi:hypothetical protein
MSTQPPPHDFSAALERAPRKDGPAERGASSGDTATPPQDEAQADGQASDR